MARRRSRVLRVDGIPVGLGAGVPVLDPGAGAKERSRLISQLKLAISACAPGAISWARLRTEPENLIRNKGVIKRGIKRPEIMPKSNSRPPLSRRS